MSIPTSRTKESAEVSIDSVKCTGCGTCVEVCKSFILAIENEKAKATGNPLFGCVACGHCMTVCPKGAVTVRGRTLSPDDLFDLPSIEQTADYDRLMALFRRRRSIREFTGRQVEPEVIEKILEAAKTSPMGYPPSDVNVLIFNTKEKNRQFAEDFCAYLKGIKWIVSNWFLALMRPFRGNSVKNTASSLKAEKASLSYSVIRQSNMAKA